MDFFARQDSSRRSTRYLLIAFALAFALVALATTVVAALVLGIYSQQNVTTAFLGDWPGLLSRNLGPLAAVAAGTFGLMVLASLFRAASIAGGGGQVARLLGGTEVASSSSDPLHKRLVNVVEEMAIASGLPVPAIYVLESEAGINAFAAGLEHSDAAVAVTRGALEQLDRDELQGVIAHEFSHVLNGDMRLNQRLIGFSFGILVLSLAGRWMLRSSRLGMRSRNRGTSVALMLGLALVVIGGIGVLLTRLIKAAVSRQRETLADASAVQFTRDTAGLAGALKKIGGFTAELETIESEEVSHMLFGSSSSRLTRWLATHPPIEERIAALDPSFKAGDYPAPSPPGAAQDTADDAAASALAGAQVGASAASEPAAAEPAGRAGAERGGGALPRSMALADELRRAIPETLYAATRQRDACLLLVIALAVSPEEAVARRQAALIESRLGRTRARHCLALRAELNALGPDLRLPLVELAIPALRQRPRAQLEFLTDLVAEIGALDETPRLFDRLLLMLLRVYLGELPAPGAGKALARRGSARAAVDALYACVAAHGHGDAAAARAAYRAGIRALGRAPGEPAFEELGRLRDPTRLEHALARLARLPTSAKRRVLAGLLALIRHDRDVQTSEHELYRVISAALGYPLPPGAVPDLGVT